MKDEAIRKQWLTNYPIGAAVEVKDSRGRSPIVVHAHLTESSTVWVHCRQKGTGANYYISYGMRRDIRKAGEVSHDNR